MQKAFMGIAGRITPEDTENKGFRACRFDALMPKINS